MEVSVTLSPTCIDFSFLYLSLSKDIGEEEGGF